MAIDLIARAMAANGGGGGTPTDAYSKTETDALLKNKVGFAEYKDNKISFYNSILKDNIIGEIDLPVDMVVDQIKTKFSQKFKFDETTYPDTENPNLDGKPVLVLAIKTSATADTFSFLNMESLVDVYTGGTTKSAIISVDPETGVITNVVRISAETGNRIVQKDDGLFVPNQSASDVSYSNTTSKLKATTTQAAIDETLGVANEKYIKPSTGIPSTDMAQSVKDSLAKADTALQEADKTELQGEIDDKLDKTAVLSDFSSEDLTNKVPSAKLVLDSFTKKVTTEAVDNDTRIVTVPENVDCFGSVAMIGGKTVKSKNLWKHGDQTFNLVTDISVPELQSLKGNVTLSFDLNTASTASTVCITITTKDGGYEYKYAPNTKTRSFITFDITNVSVIRLYSADNYTNSVGVSATYSNIQLEEGSTATEYEPYHEDLWNAPVTEIVSIGKNMYTGIINGLTNLSQVSTNEFVSTAADTRETVPYLQTYMIPTTVHRSISEYHTFEDRVYISFQYGGENYIRIGHNGKVNDIKVRFEINSKDFIIGETYTVSWKFVGNASTVGMRLKDIQVEKASASTPYTPYTKTTINLSDIYGNLEEVFPDYGIEGNYIDFETMTYHYNMTSIKLKSLEWKQSENIFFSNTNIFKVYSDGQTIKLISDKYTTRDVATWLANYDKSAECICLQPAATNQLWICSLKYSSITDFVNSLGDSVVVYEKPTPEIIPLSSILPPIHVEPNGTIEFVNEHNLDVPTKTIYKKTI